MDFPVVVRHKDLTIKLFNWMDYPQGKPARNVQAFDRDGELVWTIEPLGGNPAADCYTSINSDGETLSAFNFQAYFCIVDDQTGKIVSSQFTK